jgi:polyhydroxyalkanoate synthesis regulator phasin
VVNVGDEIEYIKNEKGFYVEKSKKDEMKELVSKVAELEKRVEKLENIYSSTKKSDGE